MQIRASQLAALSACHFWVDFSCALLMFSRLRGGDGWLLCLLLYNFCAFALQMPIGLITDRLSRNSCVAATGCVLVAAGWLLSPLPLPACVAAGLGNACFHVGGGVDVLNASEERSAALGIFVSPGAFGIFFGTLLGKENAVPALVSMAGLLLFAVLLPALDLRLRRGLDSGNVPVDLTLGVAGRAALLCCFLVVVLRSYIGMVLSFPWKTGIWPLLVTCGVVFGKAAGGFLGDRFGMRRCAAGSLALSALLFLACALPVPGTLAVFLFNMTMPVTLWAAARLLPGARGFAFGTLTFALFLGLLPVSFGWEIPLSGGVLYAAGCVLSLLLLVFGLRKAGIR